MPLGGRGALSPCRPPCRRHEGHYHAPRPRRCAKRGDAWAGGDEGATADALGFVAAVAAAPADRGAVMMAAGAAPAALAVVVVAGSKWDDRGVEDGQGVLLGGAEESPPAGHPITARIAAASLQDGRGAAGDGAAPMVTATGGGVLAAAGAGHTLAMPDRAAAAGGVGVAAGAADCAPTATVRPTAAVSVGVRGGVGDGGVRLVGRVDRYLAEIPSLRTGR